MKQNPDFILTESDEEYVLIPRGKTAADCADPIILNSTGVEVWNMLREDITSAELISWFAGECKTCEKNIRKDMLEFISQLRAGGCIIE